MENKIQLSRSNMLAIEMTQFGMAELCKKFQMSYRISEMNIRRRFIMNAPINQVVIDTSGWVIASIGIEPRKTLRFFCELCIKHNKMRKEDFAPASFVLDLRSGKQMLYSTAQMCMFDNPQAIDRKIVLTGVGCFRPPAIQAV